MRILIVIFLSSFYLTLNAQSDEISFSLSQGEVLDIILSRMKPDKKEAIVKYRNEAINVALEYTYQTLPAFTITNTLYGNTEPTILIFGKWKNLKVREDFIPKIEKVVPDFHEQRRDIWSIFKLAYYPLENDLNISIDPGVYNVAFALWGEERELEKYINFYKEKLDEYGGSIRLKLQDGKSPFRYRLDPSLFLITSWEDKSTFDSFFSKIDNFEDYNLIDAQVYELDK